MSFISRTLAFSCALSLVACNSGGSSPNGYFAQTLGLSASASTCSLTTNQTLSFNVTGLNNGDDYTLVEGLSVNAYDVDFFPVNDTEIANGGSATATVTCQEIASAEVTPAVPGNYNVQAVSDYANAYSNSVTITVTP